MNRCPHCNKPLNIVKGIDKRRLTIDHTKIIMSMVNRGWRDEEIANALHVTPGSIGRFRRKHGVKYKSGRRKK